MLDLTSYFEDAVFTTHWPLGQVISTFPGNDGRVRVAMVCTPTSTYKRPIAKLVLLLPQDSSKGESSFGGRDVRAQAEDVKANEQESKEQWVIFVIDYS